MEEGIECPRRALPENGRNGSEIETRGTISLQEVGQCPEPRTHPLAVPCRDGQTVSRTGRQAAHPDPPLRICLLDSSGWGLPGPFLLLLPLSKPGSFGTVEVGREGGACCPAKIGSFPVVGIPKGMALACLGNDASGHSTSDGYADRSYRQRSYRRKSCNRGPGTWDWLEAYAEAGSRTCSTTLF